MKPIEAQYAFWRYDKFPFVLGGQVTDIYDDGRVEIQGFGRNTTGFQPLIIFPLKEGLALQTRFNEMKTRYDRIMSDVNTTFRNELENSFPARLTKQ